MSENSVQGAKATLSNRSHKALKYHFIYVITVFLMREEFFDFLPEKFTKTV